MSDDPEPGRSFRNCIRSLYDLVAELEELFPGRPFTPDGHMVGSIGECLVAQAYGLELMPPSNEGFDAVSPTGLQVEIKATQSKRVAFRSCPKHTIVIKILANGSFEEKYNGPGEIIWQRFEGKPIPSNGQYQISLSQLERLMRGLAREQQLPRQR